MYIMNKRYPDVRALFQPTSTLAERVAEIGGFGAKNWWCWCKNGCKEG